MATEHEDLTSQVGRPILGAEVLEPHSVTLSPTNWTWLGQEASKTGRSRSQIIERLLTDQRQTQFVARERTEPTRAGEQLSVDGSTVTTSKNQRPFSGPILKDRDKR